MKKLIIIFTLTLLFTNTYGQGISVGSSPDASRYILVGSLKADRLANENFERVKVELFGGDYSGGPMSRINYTVNSRYNYTINKEVMGGITTTHELRVYKNNDKFDIVLYIFGWGLYNIKSWVIGSSNSSEFKYTNYDISGKTDVTSSFDHIPLLIGDKSGNMGIGITSTPKSKLDVNGTIRSKEVKIEATNWADHVFNSNYKLPTLEEVENHINQYKHLPDIPSEEEVLKNGISVGEMQSKLLQKIEELTLYMIEQQKEIKNLKKNKELLEKRINELENK